ncbi:RNA polymerase sigma factor [Pimelobacter simplex]|uniref:RNA polymerase sigma factor n=1 Tax=Nocardioides simplex TaxID=2045 RepID=UPI00215054FA|nr:SigE family RNA polymerase sigma factor [Pimelobacter simplex]UUW89128.1 SigE family RNA polymerase sigma factor [Pimelobacter simplex]UUW98632.1 SigE family RNA polymerase sigma factor [Pimelobacter simplex]
MTIHAVLGAPYLPAEAERPVVTDVDLAIERLYLDHWHQLVRLSVLLVRDPGQAEEITQDAFVELHRRWGRLDDPDRALAYLRQTVVNRSRSALRHRGVVQRHLARQHVVDLAPAADEPVLADSRRQLVLDALQRLPRRQREVLALRYYLELSEAEIAETLGISRGAVKSHASRGSAALRPLLEARDLKGGDR